MRVTAASRANLPSWSRSRFSARVGETVPLAVYSQVHRPHSLMQRLPMVIAPVAALVYPFILKAFNASQMAINSPGRNGGTLPWVEAATFLLLAFAMPMVALLSAMNLAAIAAPTAAELRAKRVALLAVAAPTLFTFLGVVLYMVGDPIADSWTLAVFWAAAAALVLVADNETPASTISVPIPATLRVAHGVSALAIIAMFLALHIANHLTFLAGPVTYDAVMRMFRHVYRNEVTQPILVALLFFQIATGLYLTWGYTAAPSDRFRTFQIASGVYLAFYILGHMNSVFIFARTYLGIDTDWKFATGAPIGLIKDAWNIRLVPHYAFGIFFVLSHIAAGTRVVMLKNGVHRKLADGLMIAGTSVAGIVAAMIILGMCGLRLYFA